MTFHLKNNVRGSKSTYLNECLYVSECVKVILVFFDAASHAKGQSSHALLRGLGWRKVILVRSRQTVLLAVLRVKDELQGGGVDPEELSDGRL